MNEFISGAIAMGYATAGLFFLRYWQKSHDRFFLSFASAFWILALERIGLQLGGEGARPGIYALRLLAFVAIIMAIVGKNRSTVSVQRKHHD